MKKIKYLLSLLLIAILLVSSTTGVFAETRSLISTKVSVSTVVTKLSTPKLSALKVNKQNQITVSWNKVNKAVKYRVFRKTNNGAWIKVTDTVATSFTDTKVKAGTKYTYAVRCIDKNGNYMSSLSGGLTLTPVTTPKLVKATNVSTGIQITWNKVAKVENYRVYRKVSGSSWVKIADTTATNFIDKTAKPGITYSYTVRCTTKDKKFFTSAYNTSGLTIKKSGATKTPANSQTVTKSKITDVHAKYIGLPSGAKKVITVLNQQQFYTRLQKEIDSGKIVCYPNDDLTKGVKYLAGHNPGAMSHINSINIGSSIRLVNTKGEYQDYKVVERIQNVKGSFSNVVFKSTGLDAWTMMNKSTENALIIQFCVNGQNNFWYCRAI